MSTQPPIITPVKVIRKPITFNVTAVNSTAGITMTVPRDIKEHVLIFPRENGTGSLTNDGNGNLTWQNFNSASVGVQTVSVTDSSKDGTIKIVQLGSGSASIKFSVPGAEYNLGIDPNDGLIFKLSGSATTGINDIIKFTQTSMNLQANMSMPDTLQSGAVGVFRMGTCNFYALNSKRNLFIGDNAGNLTFSTAADNIAMGYNVLKALTTGSANTAFGHETLESLTTGNNNLAMGAHAMLIATTATQNVALGEEAMAGTLTNLGCTAVGYAALMNATGDRNTAVGSRAGLAVINGTDCTCVGYLASTSGASMVNATAIGSGALCNASYRVQLGSTNLLSVGFGSTILTVNQLKQLTQLPNVPSTLIQASMWTSLVGLNQPVSTTSSPTFANLTVVGTLAAGTVGTTTIASSVKSVITTVPLDASYSIVSADASAGPMVITLPQSGIMQSMELKIVKVDATSNMIVISTFGTDTLDFNFTSIMIAMRGEMVHLIDIGGGNWTVK